MYSFFEPRLELLRRKRTKGVTSKVASAHTRSVSPKTSLSFCKAPLSDHVAQSKALMRSKASAPRKRCAERLRTQSLSSRNSSRVLVFSMVGCLAKTRPSSAGASRVSLICSAVSESLWDKRLTKRGDDREAFWTGGFCSASARLMPYSEAKRFGQ